MLQRIHIENFKSLKNVALELQQVNILIGPNNSGKSNLLKALELALNTETLKESFYSQSQKIRFCHNFEYNNIPKISIDYIYTDFQNASISVNRELIVYSLKDPSVRFSKTNVLLSSDFEKQFRNCVIYFINPHLLKNSYPLLSGNQTVSEDASNLVAFLDFLRDQHPDLFQKIQTDLNLCIPEFTQIRFENVIPTENDVKIFGDKTFKRLGLFDKTHGNIFWADELSEGVLYFLALLCIIHQPNAPKMLLLEEPERGIHPRRIKEIIGFIKQLAYEKGIQVIMTTHSPLILDEFSEIPESVFIFDKDKEGATHVKNLQKDVIEVDNNKRLSKGIAPANYTDALGDNWTIGFFGGVPV